MNLDDLLKEMKEKMQSRDLSDKYLEENGKMTRTEMGIGEYSYGITTIPCEWVYNFLSDYKKVLKENEYLKEKWNKDTHILRNELDLINANRLDLLQQNKELRKENEEVKENCKKCIIRDELDEYVNNSVPVQKIKDKIEALEKVKEKNIKRNFDTVYKDGYFTGEIDSLRELLREE